MRGLADPKWPWATARTGKKCTCVVRNGVGKTRSLCPHSAKHSAPHVSRLSHLARHVGVTLVVKRLGPRLRCACRPAPRPATGTGAHGSVRSPHPPTARDAAFRTTANSLQGFSTFFRLQRPQPRPLGLALPRTPRPIRLRRTSASPQRLGGSSVGRHSGSSLSRRWVGWIKLGWSRPRGGQWEANGLSHRCPGGGDPYGARHPVPAR